MFHDPSCLDAPLAWIGVSQKADTVVILYESSEVTTYGKKNHPGWHDIIGSVSLGPALKAKNVTLIGPFDKDIQGSFQPGVSEAIEKARGEPMPRLLALRGGKLIHDIVLPDTEAGVIKKAGG